MIYFTQKKDWLILAAIMLLAVILVGAGAYYLGSILNKPNEQAETSPTPVTSVFPTDTPAETIMDPGVNWLAKPEKLGDLQLFDPQSYPSGSVNYYKVADLINGGELIDAPIQEMGIRLYRFKKDSTGTYYLMAKNSDFYSGDEQYLNKEKHGKNQIQIDYSSIYNALDPPQILPLQNKILKTASIGFDKGQFFDIVLQNSQKSQSDNPDYRETIIKIGASNYGDIYEDRYWNITNSASDNPKIQRISYILKLADTSIIRYSIKKDFLADDGTLIAALTDKDFSSKKFDVGFKYGCGGLIDALYNDSNLANKLIQIGTASSGQPLYTIVDSNDDILKTMYEIYKGGRTEDKSLLSYVSFTAKKPILIWKDSFGNYLLFMDKDFGPLAECGKPVIYLYPERTESVSVKVGADVKISEPAYNSGWSVTADPDGSISNQDGQIYNSLFWEGTGNGSYPPITRGRVVASKNIAVELQNDLNALGLNKKEADDFMAFWLPKMPSAPFVRLTWLTTNEMNVLAPLAVSPRPDTIRRVFLDFQGQNNSETNLAPQKLTGFERKGFTLVEWGGLLVNGK